MSLKIVVKACTHVTAARGLNRPRGGVESRPSRSRPLAARNLRFSVSIAVCPPYNVAQQCTNMPTHQHRTSAREWRVGDKGREPKWIKAKMSFWLTLSFSLPVTISGHEERAKKLPYRIYSRTSLGRTIRGAITSEQELSVPFWAWLVIEIAKRAALVYSIGLEVLTSMATTQRDAACIIDIFEWQYTEWLEEVAARNDVGARGTAPGGGIWAGHVNVILPCIFHPKMCRIQADAYAMYDREI